ncbi:protein indeterminate-domain 12-like [Zingiber officinale]|uniref:Protein EARLY HEADING DATE 2 n=1 Tax=Zingiber officinale TaxID=94328 RepID=A0A8J5GJY3_ZINOF|nr:protein indeterminate-domain 12-like [Zingiber officinale]KAG6505279.1 hypothetical protein ZIOFF_037633 [Zingiber officinale]
MFLLATMSNSTSISEEASVSCETKVLYDRFSLSSLLTSQQQNQQLPPPKAKKKRNQPGNPDPDAEVVALSPKTLMATNRFICEICNKGFQRDQNLQLHRRGHNLPWKLRQRGSKEGTTRKKVYVCPDPSCVHHHPSRALGDLTGIKKHFSRKHGEKKWKCDKCSKRYAVHSDWKAHVKACGTREYRCDCGTLFARKDSFITHRAFCDALAEESSRLMAASAAATTFPPLHHPHHFLASASSYWDPFSASNPNFILNPTPDCTQLASGNLELKSELNFPNSLLHHLPPTGTASSPHLSATELLQRATAMGSINIRNALSGLAYSTGATGGIYDDLTMWQKAGDRWTRDFLGVAAGEAPGNELLMDLVTASPVSDQSKQISMLPPVTGTWN